MVTEAEFVRILNAELVGIPVGLQLQRKIEEIRAKYIAGQVLHVSLPSHDHPHVLLSLALRPDRELPFVVRAAVRRARRHRLRPLPKQIVANP